MRSIIARLLTAFLLTAAVLPLSGEAFFLSKVRGSFQVRLTSNVPGVQVSIDGQPAGVVPVTVWVMQGVHRFAFTAPGEETKIIAYSVKADTEVPYITTIKPVLRETSLTVNADRLFDPGTPYKVFVNNAEVRSPLVGIAPGPYQVRIVSGSFSADFTVTVAAGQAVVLEPKLVWEVR